MHPPIYFDCTETWSRCFFSSVMAFAFHLVQLHSDPLYWLLLSLYSFDFLVGFGLAVGQMRFSFAKFKGGIKKMLGYILLIFALLLTDHFLAENRQLAVYSYMKNWCLLYMSMVELVSISYHLRKLGLPIPSLVDVKKFRNLLRNNFRS